MSGQGLVHLTGLANLETLILESERLHGCGAEALGRFARIE